MTCSGNAVESTIIALMPPVSAINGASFWPVLAILRLMRCAVGVDPVKQTPATRGSATSIAPILVASGVASNAPILASGAASNAAILVAPGAASSAPILPPGAASNASILLALKAASNAPILVAPGAASNAPILVAPGLRHGQRNKSPLDGNQRNCCMYFIKL